VPQEPVLGPGGVEPIHIVPANPVDTPVAVYEPTQVIPQVPYQPVQTVAPLGPVAAPPIFVDNLRPAWPYFVAAIALLIGGVIGFLIGNARQTDRAALTSSTQPLDSVVDQTASVADLQNQVALLTAAQTKSAQDLSDAQAALTQAQADRDALAAQVASAGGTQAGLDAANAQVAKLQNDLKTATTQLDAANASLAQTQTQLKAAQGQLDTANATLAALHPAPLANYVNGPVSKLRSDAQANGWTLIEEPGSSATAAPGTVLEQTPAPNTTVVSGSVILVKVN
jgi:PASTA domain-containing protein